MPSALAAILSLITLGGAHTKLYSVVNNSPLIVHCPGCSISPEAENLALYSPVAGLSVLFVWVNVAVVLKEGAS